MPVFELQGSRRGRRRAFVRAQLPLLTGVVFVTGIGAWAAPEATWSAAAVFGATLIAVASALFVALPWERWPMRRLLGLALADVVGVGFLRLAYFDYIPAVGSLAVFPAVWLAYAFGRWAISLAIASCFFVTLLPTLVARDLPDTRLEIASIVTLPVLVAGLAIAVGEAARQLSLSQQSLVAANRALKKSLQRAEHNELLSRTILETVEVAMAFYDPHQNLIVANELAHQAAAGAGFSLDHEPHAGAEVRRADNKTPIPFEEQIIPRALRGDLHNHEMEWIGPRGHQRAIIAAAQEVETADGGRWGTLIAAYDVTDLARALQVKDDFIATVSHELRTPLTTIVGYVYLLEEELSDYGGIVPGAIASMKRGVVRLQARIQELLATADERNHLELRPIDLSVLVTATSEAFTERAAALGLDLAVSGTDEEAWITGDPARLEQAVENLISNALKYTPAPGRVSITVSQPAHTGQDDTGQASAGSTEARPPGNVVSAAGGGESVDSVVVEVTDTGVGMEPDELAQVFDPFWRADSARDLAIQGVGLGLGLVKNIITGHRGTIEITSKPDEGTRVRVTLPRHHY